MSKNKLQELAQRHYLSLPIYTSTKDGPDHAPRFRATVTYNGHVYHSPGYCRSAKQAETAAAEAALSQLSLESEHNPQKMKEPVSVQMEASEMPSNLRRESKKEQQGDMKEETLQQAENVAHISKGGIANVLENSELKAESSQLTQSLLVPFPSSRIQVVKVRELSKSENSGKVADRQNTVRNSSIPEISYNVTNKEQAHRMTVGTMQEKQQTEEVIQQSNGIISTSEFISDMTKTQLQEFANKGGFDLPCYSSIREGPPHALRFKAAVKFNGETYEGPGFFNTLRQAEHAAATVALKSLLEKGSSLDELSMYKNLLQEKAQKEGKALPVYNTTKSGPPHMPVFTCTVKFDGMTFEGKHANTKKQAEKSAAAVAWPALENCKRSSFSNQQLHDDKVKRLIYEPKGHEQVHVKNHTKKEATQELHVQFSHLGLGRNLSTVSHSPPSEAISMGSKKELLNNTTSVQGNEVKDEVQQPCNMSPPTKHSSGTRIRVLPDCSSSSKPWLAVNITGGTMRNQNNSS
ncbi:uncharacterized protein LOC131072210 isoform X3 [Cryptomeria japonica]|uniref:uncharacterized protein LOC131072210 isoform X3 n=1 Tax=Cryptomeria japonica TaxID=3369 RepID=UPI0027DA6D01|nr:uncharacterized protein LOC131072210 isoform X3 [Cryptomeria japonica]